MKNINRISLFILLAMFQQNSHATQLDLNLHIDGLNNSETVDSEALEFPAHTTDKYIYNKKLTQYIPFAFMTEHFGANPDEAYVTATTKTHYFNDGITRTKVTAQTIDNVTNYVTETWTSKNSSILTKNNAAFLATAIGLAAVTGIFTINGIAAMSHQDHPDRDFYLNFCNKLPKTVKYYINKRSERCYKDSIFDTVASKSYLNEKKANQDFFAKLKELENQSVTTSTQEVQTTDSNTESAAV